MKKYIIILIIILVISSLTLAEDQNKNSIDYNHYLNNLNELKILANNNIDKILGFTQMFKGNEKINLEFITNQQEKIDLKIELKNGKVDVLEKGKNEKPDLKITLTEDELNQMINPGSKEETVSSETENEDNENVLLAEADAPQVELVNEISNVPVSNPEPVNVQITHHSALTGNVIARSSFVISRSNNEQAELTMNIILDNTNLEKPSLDTNFKIVELKKQIPKIDINNSINVNLSIIIGVLALILISICSLRLFNNKQYKAYTHRR